MSRFRPRLSSAAVVASLSLGLAACSTSLPSFSNIFSSTPAVEDVPPLPAPEIPATIRAEEIVGRWGLAAYHKPEDRPRIEAAAQKQCGPKAVVINRGPTGGLMMNLADQPQLSELRVKGGPNGKNYIGPAGASGVPEDREIVSFNGRVMIARYVSPEVDTRYGTQVYVRCSARA